MDRDARLRDDVRMLGDMLGEVLQEQEGEAFLQHVETVRQHAKAARHDGTATRGLGPWLDHVDPVTAQRLARAFGLFLTLANIAEQHHRIRRRRDHLRAGSKPQRASLDETLDRLSRRFGRAALHQAVHEQHVELVLTAHPTQAARRTALMKHQAIAGILERLDRSDLLPMERASARRSLRGHITALWLTDEVRQERPDPEQEARQGLSVVEQVLWDAVPKFLRELDGRMVQYTGHGLDLSARPIRFGSWIGGDRDGNPNVTSATTQRVLLLTRWMGYHLLRKDIDGLRQKLSLRPATPTLRDRALALDARDAEPYRVLLRHLRKRLEESLDATEAALDAARGDARPTGRGGLQVVTTEEVRDVLLACYRSLHTVGAGIVANGPLLDTLRRLEAFGVHVLPLDIRQEAAVHRDTVSWLLPGYRDADEAERCTMLIDAIEASASGDADRRPPEDGADGDLGGPSDDVPDLVAETLATIDVLAKAPDEAVGAYVISMAARPSDVLAVAYLLARRGVRMPVVPLFETPDDLARAPETIEALLHDPTARRLVAADGMQVMIGYSDSAKEAGMLAAAWALHQCQERLVAIAAQYDVPITFFHGRGGTVGRGGGPAHQAITALPPGAVPGRIRLTEQGEVIQARFGLAGIAARSLELYTTATLEATLAPPAPPERAWRQHMDAMAKRARGAYRDVLDDPGFVPYFRAVTPVDELSGLKIGSRPASRGTGNGPSSLRAIPWVFAWTQNRLSLPAWLGIDEALDGDTPPQTWPFWRATLSLVEMALAKCDAAIFATYAQLSDDTTRTEALLARLATARARVMHTLDHDRLLQDDDVLARSIRVRDPYLDPLHLLQVGLLARVRAGDEEARPALHATLTAIAAGLRNTG